MTADNYEPRGGVIEDSSGNLFGTSGLGGDLTQNFNEGWGTVFELVKGENSPVTLGTFEDTNGYLPSGGVIADSSGNLYGTTAFGGDLSKMTDANFAGDGTV